MVAPEFGLTEHFRAAFNAANPTPHSELQRRKGYAWAERSVNRRVAHGGLPEGACIAVHWSRQLWIRSCLPGLMSRPYLMGGKEHVFDAHFSQVNTIW